MTGKPQAATLKVPGATLYYEAVGNGPLLLIIPGGPQDAGVFADLAGHLAGHYRVVAYDPRGNSRSIFDASPVGQDLDIHADDAARLIEALDGAPAFVFGTSGGAQIGLNLAAGHPHLVKTLVAHEPPTVLLLDDPSAALESNRLILETYRRDGVDAAMGLFFAMNGLGEDEGEVSGPPPMDDMPPEALETFLRVSGNFDYWLAHGIEPLSLYQPQTDVLQRGTPRVVVALGEQSAGQPIAAMAAALATRLSTQPVAFPGDHMGFEPQPEAFAAALHRQFAG